MATTSAISVKHVYKSFDRSEERIDSLKQLFVRLGSIGKKRKQHILKDINININSGEFIGIVGRNGSGKSTLLKILAGVYYPDKGSVDIEGTLTPFIELGVGFNPQLSGRDNVYLNGALLGFTRKEMDRMYRDIVDFAELHDSMDKKLKNYSSGMQVRLAFSIAIRANSDILLLDEVLAVGDYAFQQKCFDYFNQLKKKGRTVVLVSHDQAAVMQYCSRAILLENGHVVADDEPSVIYDTYFQSESGEVKGGVVVKDRELHNEIAIIKSAEVCSSEGKTLHKLSSVVKSYAINVSTKINSDIDGAVVGFILKKVGEPGIVTQTNTRAIGVDSGKLKAGDILNCSFELDNVFGNGEYLVSCQVAEITPGGKYYDWRENMVKFSVSDRSYDYIPLYISNSANIEIIRADK